ncbi:stage III sporulation protein AD [Alkalibacillus almallahensis]|uniref:stage III sporulation protein AD n=1 Tax=Alkalibacillus almallahensis TaxID=1379154 RepID=UPI00141EB776|nr:stage III sporulation protein AD [Alkalibacillus almallahensis]
MPFLQIMVIIIVAAILIVVVREHHQSISFLLIILTGILIFLYVLLQMNEVISAFQEITSHIDVSLLHLDTIFKVIAVAYMTEFAAHVLKDAQLNSIAVKVEIIGKLFILLMAIPIFIAVIETLLGFVP